ncbi:MAG: hypothetical protein V1724_04575, partial [Chloroflexota bacterium]
MVLQAHHERGYKKHSAIWVGSYRTQFGVGGTDNIGVEGHHRVSGQQEAGLKISPASVCDAFGVS